MAKGLAILIGAKKPGEDDDKGNGPPSEKVEAAQDLIDAVKDGDAKAVATAFATMYELCAAEHDKGGDEDEDEDSRGGY